MRTTHFAMAALCALGLVGAGSVASADGIVQEVFLCTFNDGKDMDDLMNVVEQWREVMKEVKGGGKYQAWVLTPIASNNLDRVIWIGQMPDMASFGILDQDYSHSKGGQRMDSRFQRVVDCESRSIWHGQQVK